MNDPAELHREELEHDGIQAYFSLLKGEAAGEIQVLLRRTANTMAKDQDEKKPSIDDAEQLLLAGQVDGVQLRYQRAGAYWCDTLLKSAKGARLIRIQHG